MLIERQERVVIIGASLAGATVALELGRLGVPVTLIDKSTFPRRKPCGEGLSARGKAELQQAGFDIDDPNSGCSSSQLLGYRILSGRREHIIKEKSGLTGVSRAELDLCLVQRAASLGCVDVRQGKRVSLLEAEGDVFRLLLDGDVLATRFLVIADGSHSPTLRSLGRVSSDGVGHVRMGTSSAWQLVGGELPPLVHTILVSGGEIYLTPLSDKRVNVSVLGERKLVQSMAHEASLAKRLAAVCSELGIALLPVNAPISSACIQTTFRGAQWRGAFVVGDACETFDPCAGFGMTHAVISARLAAHQIYSAIASSDPRVARSVYEVQRERAVRDVRGFTRITSMTLCSHVGRRCLPALVKSGVVEQFSHAIHDPRPRSRLSRVMSLAGF
jgi:flavin-dependent dehydrogenase